MLTWQVRNEKARRYLSSMRKKAHVPFQTKFPNADPLAVRLLERMLAFDPTHRPTAEEVRDACILHSLTLHYHLGFRNSGEVKSGGCGGGWGVEKGGCGCPCGEGDGG